MPTVPGFLRHTVTENDAEMGGEIGLLHRVELACTLCADIDDLPVHGMVEIFLTRKLIPGSPDSSSYYSGRLTNRQIATNVELPPCCIQKLTEQCLGGASHGRFQFQINHGSERTLLQPVGSPNPQLHKSTLSGNQPDSRVRQTQAKRPCSPPRALFDNIKRPKYVHSMPTMAGGENTQTEESEPRRAAKKVGKSDDISHRDDGGESLSGDGPLTPLASRNFADALMPFSRKHTLEDMKDLHGRLTSGVRSISIECRATRKVASSQDMPCQKVITWLLFQALNTPGAKVLGELLRYTMRNTEWRPYMKSRIAKAPVEHVEPGEPVLFGQLAHLHSAVSTIANTPLASIVKWQAQLAQYECLEQMRDLVKSSAQSPEATQLKSYLDRIYPEKSTYKTKLHAHVARKLGKTTGAIYRNHRWGQRLTCLTDAYGHGIMTLFGVNAPKIWSENVSAEAIVRILNMIKAEVPELDPFMQKLSSQVYDPIMAGEVPVLSIPQFIEQYPCFTHCLKAHIARSPEMDPIPAENNSSRESSILGSLCDDSAGTSDMEDTVTNEAEASRHTGSSNTKPPVNKKQALKPPALAKKAKNHNVDMPCVLDVTLPVQLPTPEGSKTGTPCPLD